MIQHLTTPNRVGIIGRMVVLPALALVAILLTAAGSNQDGERRTRGGRGLTVADKPNGTAARLTYVSTAIIDSVANSVLQRTYSGSVVAKRTSELGFKRVGRVEVLLVDQGDSVSANDLICQLDTAQLKAQIAILRAQKAAAVARLDELKAGPRPQTIAVAKAQLEEFQAVRNQIKATFDRRNRLANSDAISLQDIDDARHQLSAADARVTAQQQVIAELEEGTRQEQIAAQQAEVDRLDASVVALEVDIEESRLTAPYDGFIARRFVDEGVIVQPGQPVYRLIEADNAEAFIGLPVDVAANLDPNQAYKLDIGGVTYNGTLKAILPELDLGTRTRTVIFTIGIRENESSKETVNRPAPGQIVQLRISQTLYQEGFWLPLSALTKSIHGLWSVYVVHEDKNQRLTASTYTVKRADVEIIQIDTARVLVRGAIKDGDRIVMDGVQKITPGQQVVIADPVSNNE